ncbi:MAG TPA: IS1182 family transposase [Chloroflexota bacterium]|jgi:transposase
MPVRLLSREQGWLLPHSLEDLLPQDHPVRFVGVFVDQLDQAAWAELGVRAGGEERGAPAYHPRLLLSVWLYGFMTGVRSSRKLEAACREQLPYLWLTGLQTPDHNTLWRFYQEHREGMRRLLKRTVKTAVAAGLIDLALQAVDGSKIAGNASKSRTYSSAGLERLLKRTEAAIADLEAQNQTGGEPLPPRLPEKLRQKQALAEKVRQALQRVQEDEGRTNLTDPEAVLLRGKDGIVAGYNVQAVVSPLSQAAGRRGQLITAAAVTQAPDDHAQLLPMVAAAAANLGEPAETTLADAGYHSGENLDGMAERGQSVLMPEAQAKALANPYHKDAFAYDAETDTYTCPLGQTLRYSTDRRDRKGRPARIYRATPSVCRVCPAFGQCTKDYRHGRALEIGPDEGPLRRHRDLMATAKAQSLYSRRKELIEPTFGIIKEQQSARRLLLRGLSNVDAEWVLLAVAFNLRTLAQIWRSRLAPLLRARHFWLHRFFALPPRPRLVI